MTKQSKPRPYVALLATLIAVLGSTLELTASGPAQTQPLAPITLTPLSTYFYVQNLDGGIAASVTATIKNLQGTTVATVVRAVPGNGATLIDARTCCGLGSGFEGSAVVTSNTRIAVSTHIGSGSGQGKNFRADDYIGISSSQVVTSISLPQVVKNIYDAGTQINYSSVIVIQNAGANPANVAITYSAFPGSGTTGGTEGFSSLPPGASKYIHLLNSTAVSNSFYGSATVTSTNGQPLAVQSMYDGDPGGLQAYNGISSGSTRLYFPQLVRNIYDSGQGFTFSTAFNVMTTNNTTAQVTATFTGMWPLGAWYDTKTANPAATFDQRYESPPLPDQFYGSGVADSSQPLAGMVNFMSNTDPIKGTRLLTYNAVRAGGSDSYYYVDLPFWSNSWVDSGEGVTWSTAANVELIDSTDSTQVCMLYYNQSGQWFGRPARH